ncbi:hypothetical protein E2C01_011215 [Portunus trituberculatus]|uniref:Uncharacterized protein n=1 Tax=Portunus trituberculatus TaxID=210409 RepID=A0A5B7DB50_PORTR|nr:hypothetical protein [Portunus trituberculatus]
MPARPLLRPTLPPGDHISYSVKAPPSTSGTISITCEGKSTRWRNLFASNDDEIVVEVEE